MPGHAPITAAAKLGKVLLGGVILLVLIDPLVKVRLDKVQPLGLLEQAGPELFLELLLLELDLDVLGGVVDLGGIDVDLGEELKVDGVVPAWRCQTGP